MNNESYDFEDRKYINPTLSRDEQLSFVDNYRNSQEKNLNQIVRDTHNLGTDVPSIEGGLNGSTDLWKTQYVTPRVNSMISSLRSSAQAQALNDVLSNVQAQWKKRYNDAYRAAALRENQNGGGSGSGDGGTTKSNKDIKGDVEFIAKDTDGGDNSLDSGVDENGRPTGISSIDTHNENVENKALNNAIDWTQRLGMVSGAPGLSNTGGTTWYLINPDGEPERDSWFRVNENLGRKSIDTPMLSYNDKDEGINYLKEKVRNGYHVVNSKGTDVTPTWLLATGL